MLQALLVYFALVAVRVILNYMSLRHYLKLPLVERVKSTPELPFVSIVIPARDEQENLPRLLESLRALDYPRCEIVVVDDGSTDRTADVAREHEVRLVQLAGPPPGWTGKSFACWSGAQAAAGDWLLFTDADTIHRPESLRRVMSFALERGLPGISIFLQQRCITFCERILLPYAYQQYFVSVPDRRVNAPGDPQALANGQYILVRREAYFRAGGHEAVRGEVLDDVALATHLKDKGVLLLAARGERQASVRMYRNLKEIWSGFGKNAYASIAFRRGGGSLTALNTVLSGLAIPCAIYGLATHSQAFELAALVTYVSSVAELFAWQFLFETPIHYALFQPLAVVTFLTIAIDSLVRPKHLWKGRRV